MQVVSTVLTNQSDREKMARLWRDIGLALDYVWVYDSLYGY